MKQLMWNDSSNRNQNLSKTCEYDVYHDTQNIHNIHNKNIHESVKELISNILADENVFDYKMTTNSVKRSHVTNRQLLLKFCEDN